MTVEDLKDMDIYEVKNFIRERLMYSAEEIQEARKTITGNDVAYNLLWDTKPNITLHKRFEMSEDYKSNDDILSKFDDLGLMQSFYFAKLTFYKGGGTFVWKTNKFNTGHEEYLGGFGTVDIIHFIMDQAWGLNL
ncbi:hypothetical protein [Candidatus Venteria ishoeyi]|uniref:Uncharacterized protein n=1 Tax=Candidatus Venteria ishoeyi TaxID=1899563 RepID=A0A1H6F746_9GAMM|nr:hypothetical protein [Candidatus Venteria ishoeyi]SEH05363.1 Uncharacterised protein [Candidatus Venteria ishoeyi]